jgi:hypothetical protein
VTEAVPVHGPDTVETAAMEPAAVESAGKSTVEPTTVEPAAKSTAAMEISSGPGERQSAGRHQKRGRKAGACEKGCVVHLHSPLFRVGAPRVETADGAIRSAQAA